MSRAVIGVLTAATGAVDWKSVRVSQIGGLGAGACSIDRWMLNQPDGFFGVALGNRSGARFHPVDRLLVIGKPV